MEKIAEEVIYDTLETLLPYLKEGQEEYFKLQMELLDSNRQAWQAVQDMVSAARDVTMKNQK